MRSFIRFGLTQTVLMNLVFVGVVLYAALLAIPRLPVDRFPNIDFGQVQVSVRWPGASPADLEREVGKVIEDAIRGTEDLEFVKTTSTAGLSETLVKFLDDADSAKLFDEVRQRVLAAQNRLPSANGKPLAPQILKIEADGWLPVIQVSVLGADPANPIPRRRLALLGKELQTRLESLDGVKRVEVWGDDPEQYVLALDPGRLREHGVTPLEVVTALQTAGITVPAGVLNGADGERFLRVDGQYQSRDDLFAVAVRLVGGTTPVRVGDLVDQTVSGNQPFDGGARISVDGMDAISCRVVKDRLADATAVKAAVEAETARFLQAHADSGIRASMQLDSTVVINDSIGVLSTNLIMGFVLVLVILGVTMGLRAATLTLSGMIFSFLGTLIWFQVTGQSINELTLLGFVIVVGVLVDDAVVVLDSIARKREEGHPTPVAVVEGVRVIFWPLIASVATTATSFLPLFLMSGLVGQFFALIPVAVVAALVLSLFEALLILPAHVADAEKLFGPEPVQRRDPDCIGYTGERGAIGAIARIFDVVLAWCVYRPWTTLLGAATLFLLTIGVLVQSALAVHIGMPPLLRLEFFPSNAAVAEVRITTPQGTPLAETDALVRQVAAAVAGRGTSVITSAQGIAGFTFDSTYMMQWGSQYGLVLAELAGNDTRSFADPAALIRDLDRDMRERFGKDGVMIGVAAQQDGPPTGSAVSIRITGMDDAAVAGTANDLLAWLRTASAPGGRLEGVIDLVGDRERSDGVTRITLDRSRLERLGIPEQEAALFAATLVEGSYIGDLRRSDGEIPVTVRVARQALAEEGFDSIPLRLTPDGQIIRLSDVASVSQTREPAARTRRDFTPAVMITGNIANGSPLNAFQVQAEVETWWQTQAASRSGVMLDFGGEAESTGRSYLSLGSAFGVSLLAIYTILAMQFRSYIQPVLIMSSIVFSLTGVILLMGVFGGLVVLAGPDLVRPERALFTVNSFIAVVALTGMVVNNAIILIDAINTERRLDVPLVRTLRICVHSRLRAVLLTTGTTIAGMLTTAIGIPEFSLVWSPMATAFIAGLSLSSILTLLVVPGLYLIYERYTRVIGWILALLVGAGLAGLLTLIYA
jgi:multidrug efflux pump subunit AcrB